MDLQPVLMVADKVQTFVYADWNRTEAEVVEAFQSQAPDGLHLLGSVPIPQDQHGRACLRTVNTNRRSRYFGQYVMDNEYAQSLSELFPAGFQLSHQELADYDQRRRTAIGVPQPWAREFAFNYTGGSEPRTLKLLYFSDEGLARYCVLYHRRRLAPRFVCTIQSGPGFGHGWTMLEQAGGTFERFLLCCDPRPSVWIRKVWPGDRVAGYWDRSVAEYDAGSVRAFDHVENT
jgi:hypothetical protein